MFNPSQGADGHDPMDHLDQLVSMDSCHELSKERTKRTNKARAPVLYSIVKAGRNTKLRDRRRTPVLHSNSVSFVYYWLTTVHNIHLVVVHFLDVKDVT